SIMVGLAVITGWIFDIPILKQVIDGFPPMKFNTAICFVLCGLSMLSILYENPTNRVNYRIFSSLLLFIGLVSLSEEVFHFNTGLDTLFFNDPHASPASPRM